MNTPAVGDIVQDGFNNNPDSTIIAITSTTDSEGQTTLNITTTLTTFIVPLGAITQSYKNDQGISTWVIGQ